MNGEDKNDFFQEYYDGLSILIEITNNASN